MGDRGSRKWEVANLGTDSGPGPRAGIHSVALVISKYCPCLRVRIHSVALILHGDCHSLRVRIQSVGLELLWLLPILKPLKRQGPWVSDVRRIYRRAVSKCINWSVLTWMERRPARPFWWVALMVYCWYGLLRRQWVQIVALNWSLWVFIPGESVLPI